MQIVLAIVSSLASRTWMHPPCCCLGNAGDNMLEGNLLYLGKILMMEQYTIVYNTLYCRLRHSSLVWSLWVIRTPKKSKRWQTWTGAEMRQDHFVGQICTGTEVLHSIIRRCWNKLKQLISQISSSEKIIPVSKYLFPPKQVLPVF